jgi:hypothetical protein
MKKIVALVGFVTIIATACGGDSGYSQEEVDALADAAVSEALADAEEAEAAAEEADQVARQEALSVAVESCFESYPYWDNRDHDYTTIDEAGLLIQGTPTTSVGSDTYRDALRAASNGEHYAGWRGITSPEIRCILEGLGAPESLITRIMSTGVEQGTVEGEWDGYEASWTEFDSGRLQVFIAVQS